MQTTGLRLDQAPPFSVPLRFFLTAPLFALAAALLLAWHGPAALASRWSPAAVALTHLLTLGFLTHVMIGALMQLLPVAVGTSLPRPRRLGAAVHALLTAGTLALTGGMLTGQIVLLSAAAGLLGGAFLLFLAAASWRLASVPRVYPTVTAMRLALGALAVTASLGIGLVPGLHGGAAAALDFRYADIHLAWGLAGWVGLLVVGVAYQVVPMFQLTPSYPPRLQRYLAPVVFAGLASGSAVAILAHQGAAVPALSLPILAAVVLGGFALFAGMTLILQARRRRRRADATARFWQLGMASLLAAVVLFFVALLTAAPRLALLSGALWIVGFASSVIHGMLYKIVPFLAWLHLHNQGIRYVLPNMAEILPERRTLPHVWVHAAALALMSIALIAPGAVVYPAAALLALSYGWLATNLVHAWGVYRRCLAAGRAGAVRVD